ncbi:SH3 domain-containing protein [Neogemmobacter tilapiae]|uniref:Peptide-binding protein n=1 Tax=Neogemmobacter tilapiae TaxID=875041 RepID=A0A918WJ00_9RHOB|nr:SH3 domain-containing protein [Gemmobacter tilapiae]GHC50222.1 hypothetical protein GCM10007315_10570 [Gemmobacter tilapiae]
MRNIVAAWLFAMLPLAVSAQVLPALHDVTGVASDDVLNLRAAPNAKAHVLATLPPNATGVEVVSISPDGQWGQVSLGESMGWARLTYLKPADHPAWFTLQTDLSCFGTEPFWSMTTNVTQSTVRYTTPDLGETAWLIAQSFPGQNFSPQAVLQLAEGRVTHVAVLQGEACSDGMSDRAFGISARLYLANPAGEVRGNPALLGCCSIQP